MSQPKHDQILNSNNMHWNTVLCFFSVVYFVAAIKKIQQVVVESGRVVVNEQL